MTEKPSCNQRNWTADQGETLCLSPLQEKPISRAASSLYNNSQKGDRTNFERQSALTQVNSTVKLNFPPLNQYHVTSGLLFAISLENPKGNLRHCSLTLSHRRHSLHLRARQISSKGFLLNKLTWMFLQTANQILHGSLSTPALSPIWKQLHVLCSRCFPRWRHTKRVVSITFQPDSWNTVQSTSVIVSRVYSTAVLSWVNFPQRGKKPWWYQFTKKESLPTQETTDRLRFYLSSARFLNASFMTNSPHSYMPWLHDKQSGFKKGDGTVPQLLRLCQDWNKQIDSLSYVGALFFDLKRRSIGFDMTASCQGGSSWYSRLSIGLDQEFFIATSLNYHDRRLLLIIYGKQSRRSARGHP